MAVVAGIMAAIAIVGGAAQANAQNRAAAAQIGSLNQQRALQAQQIADQSSVQIQQATEQGRRLRSMVAVAAGDAGLATDSPSVEAALSDSMFQEDRNRALMLKAERLQQEGSQTQAQSLYNQLKPPPAWLQTLQIAGAGAQAYADEKKRKGEW